MPHKRFIKPLVAIALGLLLSAAALADTIRLRDGTVIRGQIIAFKDQQFTVLIGTGARGRRSRITLFIEDVESIEFDGALAGGTGAAGIGDVVGGTTTDRDPDTNDPPAPAAGNRPAPTSSQPPATQPRVPTGTGRTSPTGPASASSFPIRVQVRADNRNNGWTSSEFVVRRGQRVRITASGRASLGNGVLSTPTGLPRMEDRRKLMPDAPTGALIAVIGDDNDEFIFIGANQEFVAQRDGILFLGINESNLDDNSGTYEVVVEPEVSSGGQD